MDKTTAKLDGAVNDRCPWSGDPVMPDSLTVYEGYPVGFCNPGCRDKFDRARQHFDRWIEPLVKIDTPRFGEAQLPAYSPRRFSFAEIWPVADLQLKVYVITQADRSIEPTLVDAARRYLDQHLPKLVALEGGAHGVGYAIVHAGQQANWLLAHWWAHCDIVLSTLASSAPSDDQFRSADHRRFHACVWEHVVIDHERDAWVRQLRTENPSLTAYLQDRLQPGLY